MNSEVVILDAYFELTASQILKMSDLEDLSGLTQTLCKSPNSESGVDSDCILDDVLHLEGYYPGGHSLYRPIQGCSARKGWFFQHSSPGKGWFFCHF